MRRVRADACGRVSTESQRGRRGGVRCFTGGRHRRRPHVLHLHIGRARRRSGCLRRPFDAHGERLQASLRLSVSQTRRGAVKKVVHASFGGRRSRAPLSCELANADCRMKPRGLNVRAQKRAAAVQQGAGGFGEDAPDHAQGRCFRTRGGLGPVPLHAVRRGGDHLRRHEQARRPRARSRSRNGRGGARRLRVGHLHDAREKRRAHAQAVRRRGHVAARAGDDRGCGRELRRALQPCVRPGVGSRRGLHLVDGRGHAGAHGERRRRRASRRCTSSTGPSGAASCSRPTRRWACR